MLFRSVEVATRRDQALETCRRLTEFLHAPTFVPGKPIPEARGISRISLDAAAKMGIGAWAWGDSIFWGYDPRQDNELDEVFSFVAARKAPVPGAGWAAPDPANPWKAVQPMEQTAWYASDAFGLRTADVQGKHAFESFAGQHIGFTDEELSGWLDKYFT